MNKCQIVATDLHMEYGSNLILKKLGKYEDLPNMWDFLLLLAIIADFNIYV